MNKAGQFLNVVVSGIVGTYINYTYAIEGAGRIGVYFGFFVVLGLIIEYSIKHFSKG